jgi:hypothetical protein
VTDHVIMTLIMPRNSHMTYHVIRSRDQNAQCNTVKGAECFVGLDCRFIALAGGRI